MHSGKKYIIFSLGFFVILLFSACSSGTNNNSQVSPNCNINYWVSTAGSESADGTSSITPFLTINQARLAVRNNPLKGQCTIKVNIQSGTYTLQQPIIFDAQDSGSTLHKVIYQVESGNMAPVIISGGQNITDFSCGSGNLCIGSVPGLPSGIMPRQFYVNESRAIRARSNYGENVNLDYIRLPDNGYQQILPQPLMYPELVEAVTTTQWKMMRCPIATFSSGTLIMQNPCWNNANKYPVPWNFQLLSYLENAPEFLTVPNMWFLNPYNKQIQYLNTSATLPANAVLPILESLVILSGQPGKPISNITFQGLTFAYATWLEPNSNNGYVADQSGNILLGNNYESNIIGHQKIVYKTPGNIQVEYSNNISFIGNTFEHLGAVALDLGTGSQNTKVLNNTFTDISSAAIQIGGVTATDQRPDNNQKTSGNLIQNNIISYTGQDYYDSAAIFVGFTTNTTITHNTISHTPWSSIAIGWGWGLFDQGGFPGLPGATPNMWGTYDTPTIASNNKITSNQFNYFLEQLWDGGAIYTNGSQGSSFADGLLIELNVAQNKRPNAGSNIYYTDGGSQYVTLNKNVSLNNPVGTVDFGPCLTGSSIYPECLATGILPYGADMGGCLPVGNLTYTGNYFADTLNFYGPQVCHNNNIPAYPINMTFINNIPTTSATQVPQSILDQAGVQ